MFRALLLCSSQWGWWPTLQAGDPLRFHNSTSFHKIARFKKLQVVKMCVDSNSFVLGHCKVGGAYWMAVAGTVCTFLASSLTVFAYKSTKSHKTMYRRQDGEKFICVP